MLFAQQHLASGALVAPISHGVSTGENIGIAWRRTAYDHRLDRFLVWLKAEMRR
jgi:hypothetical protein